MVEPVYFSQKELAARWKITSAAVGQYRKKRLITAVRLPHSKRWIYPVKDILDYEGKNTQQKEEDFVV